MLQKNGYTLEQISQVLRGEGLDVATPTLKSYLLRARPASKKPAAQPSQDSSAAPLDATERVAAQKDSPPA